MCRVWLVVRAQGVCEPRGCARPQAVRAQAVERRELLEYLVERACRYPDAVGAIAELTAVRLRTAQGRWPAGSRGVVVNYRPGWPIATVDFSELVTMAERGRVDFSELVREVDLGNLKPVGGRETLRLERRVRLG